MVTRERGAVAVRRRHLRRVPHARADGAGHGDQVVVRRDRALLIGHGLDRRIGDPAALQRDHPVPLFRRDQLDRAEAETRRQDAIKRRRRAAPHHVPEDRRPRFKVGLLGDLRRERDADAPEAHRIRTVVHDLVDGLLAALRRRPLGDGDQRKALAAPGALDARLADRLQVIGQFRNQNHVRPARQARVQRQPARVAPHQLDEHHAVVAGGGRVNTYLAGIDMKHFYQMMLKHFRNLLLVKIAADGSSSFDIAPEQIKKLKNQVQSVSRETLQRYLEILIKEEDSFRRSQEARMKLETVIVGLAYLEPIIPLGEIISTIEALEQKLRQGLPVNAGNSEPQLSTSKPVKEIPANYNAGINIADENNNGDTLLNPNKPTGNLETLGDDLKKFIKKESAILGAKIDSAEILSYADGLLTLGFPKGYLFLENISEKSQKEQLQQIAGSFFQENVTLKIQINKNQKVNASDNNGRSKANNINDIKREAMNHPILQKVLDEFSGAELVEIKPRTDKKQGG